MLIPYIIGMRRISVLDLEKVKPLMSLNLSHHPGRRITTLLLEDASHTPEAIARVLEVLERVGGRILSIRPTSVGRELDIMVYAEVPDDVEERVAEEVERLGICRQVSIIDVPVKGLLMSIHFPQMVGDERSVVILKPIYSGIIRGLRERFGDEAAKTFLYYVGYEIGESLASYVRRWDTASLEEAVKNLLLIGRALGYAVHDVSQVSGDEVRLRLLENWESDALGRGYREPQCHLSRGVLNGYLDSFTGSSWSVEEAECWSRGDRGCLFIVRRR